MNCCFSSAATSTLQDDENVMEKIQEVFPGAIKSSKLANLVKKVLSQNGYSDDKTLIATSLCCDEVNRELEADLTSVYNFNFSMGGLAGFAFGGVTSFGAMAHHIPDNGSCLVVYGPHVGVDKDGTVGKVNRRGRDNGSGICCGSAAGAAAYCKSVQGGSDPTPPAEDALDAQQTFVGNMLLPHADRISSSSDPDVELPLALFDVQDEFMKTIVSKGCGEVAGEGKIAILGGIQINTPSGTNEYFLPKVFQVMNNKGETISDLIGSLK
jgi:hypothetical protein